MDSQVWSWQGCWPIFRTIEGPKTRLLLSHPSQAMLPMEPSLFLIASSTSGHLLRVVGAEMSKISTEGDSRWEWEQFVQSYCASVPHACPGTEAGVLDELE